MEVAIDGQVVIKRGAVGVDQDRLLIGPGAFIQTLQLLFSLLADVILAPRVTLSAEARRQQAILKASDTFAVGCYLDRRKREVIANGVNIAQQLPQALQVVLYLQTLLNDLLCFP
jgi:hypothetical protein